MADTEKLHFKIGLAGTYWSKVPVYSILVNDDLVVGRNPITAPAGEIEFFEFDYAVNEGPCTLKIRLDNKDNQDTVQNTDKTEILKDLLLNIKSVEIDEINLGNMIYSKSTYVGDDPDRPTLDNCIDLGWNGTWILEFSSPFYIWLLENI
jgi:hypothetical protein